MGGAEDRDDGGEMTNYVSIDFTKAAKLQMPATWSTCFSTIQRDPVLFKLRSVAWTCREQRIEQILSVSHYSHLARCLYPVKFIQNLSRTASKNKSNKYFLSLI
jgi:hypothetical protein